MSHCEPWGSCHSDPTKPTHCSVCGESGCKPIGVAAALREAEGRYELAVSQLNLILSSSDNITKERDTLKAELTAANKQIKKLQDDVAMTDIRDKIRIYMDKHKQCTLPDGKDWFLAKAFALWQLLGLPEEQFHKEYL